ncbi:hypothetical protein V7S43_009603 [Phytophthora oleae]|uniref:Uncharacterized protein n=1 Tax=Phytophthora oleae TaxID=2107226 RepID=A0ABD3FKP9_9STRA
MADPLQGVPEDPGTSTWEGGDRPEQEEHEQMSNEARRGVQGTVHGGQGQGEDDRYKPVRATGASINSEEVNTDAAGAAPVAVASREKEGDIELKVSEEASAFGIELNERAAKQSEEEPTETMSEDKTTEMDEVPQQHTSEGYHLQRQSEKEQAEITPQQTFELLLGSLQESTPAKPLDMELQLVAELFRHVVERNDLDIQRLGPGTGRHPTRKEQGRLLALCRLITDTTTQTYAAWEAALDSILLLAVQAKWHITHAIDNVMAKINLKQSKPLHEWVQVVRGNQPNDHPEIHVTTAPAQASNGRYMFNPAKYNQEMQQRLSAICMQPYHPGDNIEGGSADEWRVIDGIASGNILCKSIPPIAMKLLGADGCFELHLLLHANVEGELHMPLLDREKLH